ncbi:MAG: FAD/NAD(P)-binding protein [Pseudomonas atacamensis]|uniref:FAD/NAD(P)-binding protein n=1 Tax=Pseudomonas atacamensis TaxID=2565368 RepID=UPI003315F69C
MKTLAIIGAGFSGTVVAVNFLNNAPKGARLVMINRSGQMAKGLAYGTNSPAHLLNVPAGNMTAVVSDPDSYLKFCQRYDKEIQPSTFTTRKLYGEYLEDLLLNAAENAKGRVNFEQITAYVIGLSKNHHSAAIELDNGSTLNADQVILALGHFPPLTPQPLSNFGQSDHYIPDPWSERIPNIEDRDATVILVGGGLTALDVICSLKKRGHTGKIHMLSRRGLIPLPHRQNRGTVLSHQSLIEDLKKQLTPLAHLRIIRRYINSTREADWRDVIAALRPITTDLWKSYPEREKRRFLRHLQPHWDVHRHRVAPNSYRTFADALASSQVIPVAGRIKSAHGVHDGIELRVHLRGRPQEAVLVANYVINCTGPNSNPTLVRESLIKKLLNENVITTDVHNLGINVDTSLAVVNGNGDSSEWLSYVGPMLKATLWEATAVPELRIHATALSNKITKLFS